MKGLTFKEALKEDEIFLVSNAEDEDAGPIYMFDSVDDLEQHLSSLTPSIDACVRVLHGVLTTAEYLPPDFRGKTSFVVCVDPDDATNTSVVESGAAAASELAEEIESYLSSGFALPTLPDIDDIFILYGYEVSTCLSINLDEIDDEALDTCKMVADAAREIKAKAEED